jgi:hypothetical protein
MAVTCVLSLIVATGGAQAVVVDMNAVGKTSVRYNPSDQSGYAGVALVPGTRGVLTTIKIPTVTSSAPCSDPWLSSDLSLPATGLCWHAGGAVMHSNETFALAWDPARRYWQTTRNYVEQFLGDVAAGSGTLTSPYAVTTQYNDAGGRAANKSLYGGGCIDYGDVGGSACKFGDVNGTGAGHSYPGNGCPVTGSNQFHEELSGVFDTAPNDICLTDAQLQGELKAMIPQTGLVGRTQPGHTPVVVLLMPPGVETCLDAAGTLCSANGASAAQFCSYHSQINVGGTEVSYLVQPWTASWTASTGCDDPGINPIKPNPSAQELATDVGIRLVSPLSQAHIATIVNPRLNGWFALGGAEVNDNGCVPLGDPGNKLDSAAVGSSPQNPYLLQREFNNAGVIESDPNALACTPAVALWPTFVVPSAVNEGDVVALDGSTTISSLIVPKAGYVWDFGDGTTAVGPSVEHSFAKGGAYSVKLTVTDRGGNVSSLSQTIEVLGSSGQSVPPPVTKPPSGSGLQVHLQLMPQGLRGMLRAGVGIRVSCNEPADGIVTLSIPRAAARRAHIKARRGPSVVIGRGTLSGIKDGTVSLHLRLSRVMIRKLKHLRHVTMTVRLALVARSGDHLAIDAAGRY